MDLSREEIMGLATYVYSRRDAVEWCLRELEKFGIVRGFDKSKVARWFREDPEKIPNKTSTRVVSTVSRIDDRTFLMAA